MGKSLFIAFEGIDGSGKSTQIKLLAKKLTEEGYKVYTTAEPTTHPIGKMIRDIFSHKMEADHRTIAALFAADRLEHVANKSDGIIKKLQEGYIVITDRYYFSSYAYHSVHMDMDWVIETNSLSAQMLRPDVNIFIDISAEESMHRINKNRAETELYETLDNLKKVKALYFNAFEKQQHLEKISIINGERDEAPIAGDVWKVIDSLLQ